MSTITLPNIRVSSDLTVKLKLKDGGVALDWSTLQNIKVSIYSDAQRALAGRCGASIDAEDPTLLVCTYAANKPQYVGVNRVVVSAKYMGETKTYDKPAFNFVRWTDDQAGEQITIDDPDIDVEISVEDVSSSILQEAVDAAFTAADRANDAAEAAEHMVDIHTGPEGKSAYEVAVEEGFVGTEEEWLASLKGDTGETPDITIGTVTTAEPGTPAAATMTGTPEDPVLNLTIPKGAVGATPNFTVGTVTTGAPGSQVVVTITGTPEAPVLNVTIPQGMQGNTGSSVDYPYELVNNLTTDDATKGLTAAQGKVLDGKVSQLEAKVSEVVLPTIEGKTITLNGTIGATINLTPRTESGWRCVLQNCVAGDSFTITGKGGIGTRLWGFVDSNNILIAVSNSSITGTNLRVIAPAGAAYFVSNSSTTPLTVVFKGKDSLPDIIDKVDEILEEYTYDAVGGVWSVGRCVISDRVIYPSYTAYRYHIFDASAGDIISYSGRADSNTSILAKQDADGIHYTNIVAGAGDSTISGEYTVTESGKYVICGYNNYATSAIITTDGRLVAVEEEIDALNATIEEQEERISELEENYTVIDLSTEISGATNERYISYPGGVITVGPSGYCYTSPINVKKGDLIILYSDSTDLLSAISTCDSSGNSISPAVQGRPHGSYSKYEYVVTQNGYVILSFYGKSTAKAEISRNNALSVLADNPFAIEGSSHLLAITDNPLGFIKETPGFASAFESWGFIGDSLASGEIWGWLNVQKSLVGAKFDKMVDATGNIVDASGYIISEPLQGQTYKPKFVVEFADSTGLSSSMCVIAKCDASGNILSVGAVGGSAIKYMFSVSDNQYVVICYPSGNIPSVRCVSNFVQDNYDISWGQYMCRNCGSVGVNYSVGGGTAKKFVLGQSPFNSTNSLTKLKSDTQKQAYIIAFGVNDKNDAMYDANVTDIEDIGADVNLADPSQNANTFAGYYARAIQEIKTAFPDSFIFLVTIPESSGYDEMNTIIRAMPGIFEGTYNSIYVLDLKEYLPSSVLSQFRMNGVHFNAQGYEYFASVFCTYIDWLFRTHSSEFKGVSLIGKALLNNPS